MSGCSVHFREVEPVVAYEADRDGGGWAGHPVGGGWAPHAVGGGWVAYTDGGAWASR